RIVPSKMELVPSVADVETCQKTFFAWVPPVRTTCVPPKSRQSRSNLKDEDRIGITLSVEENLPGGQHDRAGILVNARSEGQAAQVSREHRRSQHSRGVVI